MKLVYWLDTVPFLAFGAFVLSHEVRDLHHLIGTGLAAGGFLCWTVARLQLGRSFRARAEARALVTTGLYSKFRHPVYLFAGVAYTGLFIAQGWPIALVGFLLLYSTQLLRVRKEEAVLEQAFGEEYRRYKASTWL